MLNPQSAKCREAIAMLELTATGRAIIEATGHEEIAITEIAGLNSSGITTAVTSIQVMQEITAIPNMAMVIGHELTHCLDLMYWRDNPERNDLGTLMTPSQIGRSEVNAHFNQGKIGRELKALANKPDTTFTPEQVTAVTTMANSSTTFGKSIDWLDRHAVVLYLISTEMYSASIKAACEHNNMFNAWSDSYWCDHSEEFHSEAHFNDDHRWNNAEWVNKQKGK